METEITVIARLKSDQVSRIVLQVPSYFNPPAPLLVKLGSYSVAIGCSDAVVFLLQGMTSEGAAAAVALGFGFDCDRSISVGVGGAVRVCFGIV